MQLVKANHHVNKSWEDPFCFCKMGAEDHPWERVRDSMKHLTIEKVIGREIIDSRGNPTVEAEVYLSDGTMGRGTAPSGASTGEFEALELRDGDKEKFGGKGVSKAVANVNTVINEALKGVNALDIYAVDAAMIKADGTKDERRCQSGSKRTGSATVSFPGWCKRQSPATANDEHLEWWCTCSQHGRCTGIHDHACRRSKLQRRSALVYGSFPRAGSSVKRERSGYFRR